MRKVVESYLASKVRNRDSTKRRDRSYVESFILPTLGSRPVGVVGREDVRSGWPS